MTRMELREARPDDAAALTALIRELAVHDGASADANFTPDQLRSALAGPAPRLRAILAVDDARPIGFVTYTIDFAIWTGSDIIRIDDLFVSAEARGKGIGQRLMSEIARRALAGRMQVRWEIMPGNAAAQGFYRRLGAELHQKVVARWDHAAMTALLAEG
jgi:ribosomal protein S18 acetylase RimI-like enzyme